ncbi:MAG: aspartate-semialdehyde dehydrogenase [Gammaproteobacteria bacterium]|jgi:aspartate-semialdehyde dehydrogenase|nr:aspartate-semialdehyde dehydrogenase [Gammaproteobacteria bacterium]MDP6616333.1 aspartate-semialdehyde dehydrogenase [Gammaproteobacteria bacterium]MDP6695911.1 aspartate-semialdehyde dehydrogenase [Gammaproteobacteria bacterium]MDP7041456.1 aspartate-semialdehyde dehydrogenase [Gammaproteobacteria bacterium]
MKDELNIAVVGATGMVGEAMLDILAERNFPVGRLHALASERSVGKSVRFGSQEIACEVLDQHDFSDTGIALFSAGASVSAGHAPRAAEAGCFVVDNTSHFRRQDDIPLVVPEVNAHAIAAGVDGRIIANPNCSTIQMVVALKPIYDAVGIERINVATYQAVSGAGRSAVETLANQTVELLNGRPLDLKDGNKQIAFNAIPHIDTFQDNGYTREEMKMVWETRKIFGDEEIRVNPTAVRIPAFIGHSEAVHIETREPITADRVRELLGAAEGVQVLDEAQIGGYPTAVTEASGTDPVYVGRIREDISHDRGISMWVVADNLRKGAALNSVQIAEILVREYL